MSHVPRATLSPVAHDPPSAPPRAGLARINEWMRRYSWLVAMTVAIVITVGGLVILESGRMRIAAEYETALDAKTATADLSALAADIATLSAQRRAFVLQPDPAYKSQFDSTAAHVRRALSTLDAYYRRIGDDTALASFAQVSAAANEEIESGAARLAGSSPDAAEPSASDNSTLDAALSLLRLNEEQRAQHALDTSRADQRISTLCVGALCALNIVLFLLLFRNLGIQLDKQDRVQKELITQQEELDQLVFERTRQLEALAWHLQSVSEDEKTQLARELHDELGSILTASKMDVAWVRGKLRESEPAMAEKLSRAIVNLDQGIALKRRIIEDLRPSALSNLGLIPALEILTREFSQRSGLQLSLELADVATDDAGRLALYRLVQEALTNVLRHARAQHVRVSLAAADDGLQLHIRDDGQGFDPEAVGAGHHGLLGMRYRIESLGGTLQLLSAPGRGTLVLARLPRRDQPPPSTSESTSDRG